ncbi:hypothetical protein LZC95_01490 [Pendulispora brunnea]|uniref:Uncharacterized protein n=1 Tax=Pendulispora brunnea TaxID=2905690 RepID=A0ABZ2KF50_9BACT
MRIAVDMDEVLADTLIKQLEWLNTECGHSLTLADVVGKDLYDFIPEKHGNQLLELLRQGAFFADLPVMKDSQEVLRRLAEDHEVFIATAAMEFPGSFGPKFRWLAQHFPFIEPSHIVFCGNKSILHADALIDDTPRNLAGFQGRGILFSSPHNVNVTGYARVSSWREVEELFRA